MRCRPTGRSSPADTSAKLWERGYQRFDLIATSLAKYSELLDEWNPHVYDAGCVRTTTWEDQSCEHDTMEAKYALEVFALGLRDYIDTTNEDDRRHPKHICGSSCALATVSTGSEFVVVL